MAISYSAVVLDERSKKRLISRFNDYIPEGWKVMADHLTINLGEIAPEYEKYLGLTIRLSVDSIAEDNNVIALGTSGFESKNEYPHITLAVNVNEGGKPMMSKYLTDWKPIKHPLQITGTVKEVPLNLGNNE